MLTQAILKENLHYNPETGIFTWIKSKTKVKRGDIAGYTDCKGYIAIGLNKKLYRAHRLAWLYVNGIMPTMHIDHVNRIKADNRIDNLRQATAAENNHNKDLSRKNKSGFKGVCWNKKNKKWRAECTNNGKSHHLGYFVSAEAASIAYQEFSKSISGVFFNHV
jgi:hypothetical protein